MISKWATAAMSTALLLGGCGLSEATHDAERQVGVFHSRLDAENYAAIWDAGDDGLRTGGTQAELERFLAFVHGRLGKVEQTEQVSWRTNVTPTGSFVTLVNSTTFEKGHATETFAFVGSGNATRLHGYNINSPEIFVDPGTVQRLDPGSTASPAPVVVVAAPPAPVEVVAAPPAGKHRR